MAAFCDSKGETKDSGVVVGEGGGSFKINHQVLAKWTEDFSGDDKNVFASSIASKTDLLEVVLDRDAFVKNDHCFSNTIQNEGKATSQKSSGRCWMFAAFNTARVELARKYNLAADFEFSQSYLFFYDKLERAHYFLLQVLQSNAWEMWSVKMQFQFDTSTSLPKI